MALGGDVPGRKATSTNPSAVRQRLRKKAKAVNSDLELLYKKPIEEWDMEELARGRPKNRNGNFSGPRPQWVTPLIMKEAQNRLRILTKQEMSTYAGDAVRVMGKLMNEDGTDLDGKPLVPASVRLQAATYIYDQVVGKATQHVEVEGNIQLQAMFADALVMDDNEQPAHPVIDAEVVEDINEDSSSTGDES